MSLYIVARQSGAIPRLLRLRAFSTDIGLDIDGALCVGSPRSPLFSIIRKQDQFFLQAAGNGVSVDSRSVTSGTTVELSPSATITALDYTMTTLRTSSASESAARLERSDPGAVLGSIEMAIAGVRQKLPLFEGEFTVGSSEDDSLLIPLRGIAPRHLVSKVAPGRIEVTGFGGTISIDGVRIQGTKVAVERTTIRLESAGVSICVEPYRQTASESHLDRTP